MKKVKTLLTITIVLTIFVIGTNERSGLHAETLFPYPAIPDSITDIQSRWNYYTTHFWDRAPIKSIFSSKARLSSAFKDYISPLRFSSIDTVKASIGKLMKSVEKKPENQLFLAQLAEDYLYGDSAEIWSDELYLEFIRPVIANKRVSRVNKERLILHEKQLSNTTPGKPLPQLHYTSVTGEQLSFVPKKDVTTIIFFNDPECSDCNLARVRLQANARATELQKSGKLDIVALSLCEPDNFWRERIKSYPQEWIIGANPDLDLDLDLRNGTPTFYIIDKRGYLAIKNIDIEDLLNIFNSI